MKGTPRGLRLRPRDTLRRMSHGGYRLRRADVTPPSRDTLVWHRVCVLPRRYKRAGTRRTHRTPGLAGSWSRHRGRRPDSIRPGDLTNTAPHWLDRRYFGVHCLTSRRTASFGAGSRTVTTTFVNLYGSVETHGDAESVLRVTREFAKLDASFHSGKLSPRSVRRAMAISSACHEEDSSANLKCAVKWESLADRRVHDPHRAAATQ